jgi:GxxExxY protein
MMSANEIEAKLAEVCGIQTPNNEPCEAARDDRGERGDRCSGLHALLTRSIIGAAIEVHRHVGPGQLEGVYQRALHCELGLRQIPHRAQAPMAMTYKGMDIGDYVADFIVEDKVVVELKAVHALEPVHHAQVLSYLRATGLRVGLLINFNVPLLRDGVRRLIL